MRIPCPSTSLLTLGLVVGLLSGPAAIAGDWPMWRFDAQRTAASPGELPATLYLQWVQERSTPAPAWPASQNKLQFDATYEPVVLGTVLLVPSMVHDSIRACDTETGAELWRYYTDGPIRVAPVAHAGKVYVTSDAGSLHCLDVTTGTLLWKFDGCPTNKKVLGNERLVSAWPGRGGPVVANGNVFFAASIWPFMGLFVYALDAQTGSVVWANTGDGSRWTSQQHTSASAFASVSPQGHLVAAGNTLLVPGGRTVPAAFDINTGALLHFNLSNRTWDKDQGGFAVAASGDWYHCGPGPRGGNTPGLYNLATGAPAVKTPGAIVSVFTGNRAYDTSSGVIRARDYSGSPPSLSVLWDVTPSRSVTALFCKAGARLYAGGTDCVVAVEDMGGSGIERWAKDIVGTPTSMLAADDKLFVITEEGCLYCFGETDTGASLPSGAPPAIAWPPDDAFTAEAQAILTETEQTKGYGLILGLGTGRLAEALVQHSGLRLVGMDPDPAVVHALRQRWEDMGIPGERLSAIPGTVLTVDLPAYVANLVVTENPAGAGSGLPFTEAMFECLRPYGGVACFPGSAQGLFDSAAAGGLLANAVSSGTGGWALLTREGSLPGSADWTHQYGDAANTASSPEARVKAPLGILWFGGSSNPGVLPRHGHGPSEQVIGGRLFLEGVDFLRALDVYTGRILWEKPLPGVGQFYNNTSHEPGANHIGSNYVSAEDAVYIIYGNDCLMLDPVNGATLDTFTLPGGDPFSQIRVWGDYLVAAGSPLVFDAAPIGQDNWNGTCSSGLHVLNRHTGAVLWSLAAGYAFQHNTIIASDGRLYCIDRMPPEHAKALKRRGLDAPQDYTLLALDLASGNLLWSTMDNVFGTWLGCSAKHGVLLQSGRASTDMVSGEPFERMAAYSAATGDVLWDIPTTILEGGPHILYDDLIISQFFIFGTAFSLLTGDRVNFAHPLSQEPVPWKFTRSYGCGTAIACTNLLTFRSGAAGYYDMERRGGTGNFGGFKSGCTSNLIPANGVLSAPDYTRTCKCSYQNQTSLALVHEPDTEAWTFGAANTPSGPVKNLGLNLGAPGDRVDDSNVLWLDFPSVGSYSPDVTVHTTPETPASFRNHSAFYEGHDLRWVAASGATGLDELEIQLNNIASTMYTVRLYFAEQNDIGSGQRIFDIALQGELVAQDLDVFSAAGGARKTLVREFSGIGATDTLLLTLTPSAGAPVQETLLSGIAVLVDSDEDMLCDIVETDLGTNPSALDTDDDGLSDYEEVWYDGNGGYDPYNSTENPGGTDLDAASNDTDNDGIDDGTEIYAGFDPLSAASTPFMPFSRTSWLVTTLLLASLGAAVVRRRTQGKRLARDVGKSLRSGD